MTINTIRSSACLVAVCGLAAGALADPEWRSYDGSGNNQAHTDWGSAGSQLLRIGEANYADGISSIDTSRPNPRDISNVIFSQSVSKPDDRGLSEWTWLWGQFIDHDITHSLTAAEAGAMGTTIPIGDPTFDNGTTNMGGQTINMTRSAYDPATGTTTPRQQLNNLSSWIDASNVYGGTDIDSGAPRSDWLRTFSGGRMKVSDGGAYGDLLPTWSDGAPEMDNVHMPTMGEAAYVAGDIRANEHTGLAAVHTLFVREHNRLADMLTAADPSMSDEEAYQRARSIVAGTLQKITYSEFLPAMGVDLDAYSGYDSSVNGGIANEFSAAGYRVGHTMIRGTLGRMNADGTTIAEGDLSLADSYFNPATLQEGGLDPLFRGLLGNTAESIDAQVADQLRNQLFTIFIPGVGLVDGGTDLASINIMRGRDHGLGTYNQTREAYGLTVADDWSDITSDAELQAALASVYGSVDEVDLWVGMLCEQHMDDSSVGEMVNAILADQFGRLRDGDRFFYQNLGEHNSDLTDIELAFDGENMMTAAEWLDSLTLADILELNTDLEGLPENMFFQYNIPAPGVAGAFLTMGGLLGTRRRRSA